MRTFSVRVWLPDRPGALGQVASRIGAVRGEIVGIDILERGAGRAIDELVVQLPDDVPVDLLVGEISQVDGVDVEELRAADESIFDARLDALETAALLVKACDLDALLAALVGNGRRTLGGQWTAVVRLEDGEVLAAEGDVPPAAWVAAFVGGSQSSAELAASDHAPDDIVWCELPAGGLAVVVGRDGTPFRSRERSHASALARIADHRLADLTAVADG